MSKDGALVACLRAVPDNNRDSSDWAEQRKNLKSPASVSVMEAACAHCDGGKENRTKEQSAQKFAWVSDVQCHQYGDYEEH